MQPYEAMRYFVLSHIGDQVGERVRPEMLSVNDALPACIVTLSEHRPIIGLTERLLDIYRCRVSCLAPTRASADALADALHAMDGDSIADQSTVWTVHLVGGGAETATVESEANEAIYSAYVDVDLIRA